MKCRISILAGLVLAVAVVATSSAQQQGQEAVANEPANFACPLGQPCGQGRLMTPEQRAQRQNAMQTFMAGLREKKANNTITPAEQAWLEQMEQRGGLCINGVPRGPRGGFCAGQGNGLGRGQGGMGRGWRGGQGANPNCPFVNAQPAK